MVGSCRGDDFGVDRDCSVRRDALEARDDHQIVAHCVHRLLTGRQPPMPAGVVDHFRLATRDDVRTACRSQSVAVGEAVRHGSDHPSLWLHGDIARAGTERDDRIPSVASPDDNPVGTIHDNRAAALTHDGCAGELM